MTDQWESITWSKEALSKIINQSESSKATKQLEFLLDGKVARLPFKSKHHPSVFLVPMTGGIWTLCVKLTEDEFRELISRESFPASLQCVNYLNIDTEPRADWQHRMQNLSISCALVCLIILGSAALIGAFGICQRQISAILVTGILYLLAALFAFFTLMIIHFKRTKGKPELDSFDSLDGTNLDGLVATRGSARLTLNLLSARIFSTSWSWDLGWGGVAFVAIASLFWILLSKMMRFSQLLM